MKEFDKKYFFWGGVELFLFLVLAASNVFADNLDKIFTLNTSFSTTLKFQWKAEVWLKCCRLTCSKNRHWWISKMITSSKNIIWVPEVGLCWESQSCIKSKTWGLDDKKYDRLYRISNCGVNYGASVVTEGKHSNNAKLCETGNLEMLP